MAKACELGARNFDASERLIRVSVPGFPDRSGFSVTQQSVEYAIALLETEGDAARANQIIDRVLDFQVRDPNRVGYGNFLWMSHWTEVKDWNAVCFLVPRLVYVWNRHRRRLRPRVRERLWDSFPLCVHGLHRHRVDWTYTNIYLLSILSRFLLAPLLPRTDLDCDARAMWTTFLKGTAHFGIVEYNSPTYTPIAIYVLEELWRCGPRDLRKEFQGVLEWFYFEFACRYHASAGLLAGAMSRAYPWDMEAGRAFSAIVAHLQWGLHFQPTSTFVVNWLLANYTAPDRIRRLALRKPPSLEIRADVPPKQISRTDYLTNEFTLGSQTGGWYGGQEVPVLATVRGPNGGEAIRVRASVPQAARFTSQQRGPALVGIHHFDPAAVGYYLRHQRPGEPTRFQDSVAFCWHLGGRATVREVWIHDRRWNGKPLEIRGTETLVVGVGDAWLSLRARPLVRGTPERPVSRLFWEDDHLAFLITFSRSLKRCARARARAAMAFHLRMAPRGNRTAAGILREAHSVSFRVMRSAIRVRCDDLSVQARHGGRSLFATLIGDPFLHRSKLATIRPDDLRASFAAAGK